MTTFRSSRVWVPLILVSLAVVACGPDEGAAASDPWGSEAVDYFDGLAAAYTENDFYGVLDYYASDAFVEKWRGDLRGGALVRDLLRFNSGDLDQQILALHLGSDGAITLTRWPATDELSAVFSQIESGLITGEAVYDLGGSLRRGQRVSPDVLAVYERLYMDYARIWTDGDEASLARLYEPDATIHDPLFGVKAFGLPALLAASAGTTQVEVASAARVGRDTSEDDLAVYLGPAEYGQDSQRAVGVFHVTDEEGCVRQVAVAWQVNDGRIIEEHRYQEVETFSLCSETVPPTGWWSGLALPPPPRDQVVTGVLRTDEGREIKIHNGTRLLEDLVLASMRRFVEAGLGEPVVENVTFEPSRRCQGRSGRLLQADGSRNVFLCYYEDDLCRGSEPCSELPLIVRSSVLHELAHAWVLDHVNDDAQQRLLELAGLEVWGDPNAPWAERGEEYSAEVITWGLLDEYATMVRIGSPTCEVLTGAFQLLTDVDPLRVEGAC